MGYALGVDLGTTYTAAAVARDGRVDVVGLGERAPQLPSVLYLLPDGRFLAGEAAQRRGAAEPGRLAREFKRRLGDDTALLVGGTPFSAQALMGQLLRHVLAAVAEGQGGPAQQVIVTYPANWGPYRRELLGQVFTSAGLDSATTCSEPEAAAIHFASTERVALGDIIATYDLGGGTFDAAVLRKTNDGFELLGEAGGIEHLGGVDFDAAVFDHVVRSLGTAVRDLDPNEAATQSGLERLRRDCVEAKEALSADTEVVVPVNLPSIQTVVRLSRSEFEKMVRPAVLETVGSLEHTLRSAGVPAKALAATVLVGGSARLPLVAETLTEQLGVPVSLSPAPKHCVAIGAAQSALASLARAPAPPPPAPPPVVATVAAPPSGPPPVAAPPVAVQQPAASAASTTAASTTAASSAAERTPRRSVRDNSKVVLGIGLALLVVALVLAFAGPQTDSVADQAPPGSTPGLKLEDQEVATAQSVAAKLDHPLAVAVAKGTTLRSSSMGFSIGGLPLHPVKGQKATEGMTINLNNRRLLVGGPLQANLTANGSEHTLLFKPKVSKWATIPGVAWILLLLFVISYAESVQRNVRRRRNASFVTIFGMNLVGLLLGVSIVLAAWTVGQRLLPPWAVVSVLLCCAVAGGCLPVMLSERAGPART